MNRDNVIEGQKIDRHPFSDRTAELGIYVKGATVIAAQAPIAGVVKTPEGEMRFQAGDYIVTDNPPTHAWPVRQQVFDQTYNLSHKLEEGQFPTTEPVADEQPAKSVPPTHSVDLKAQEIGMERAGAEYSVKEPQVAQAAPKATSATKGRKSDRHAGIADSRSLGLQEE